MAEFETKCPHCGTALTVQEEWIGMELECPECKQTFPVQKDPVTVTPAPAVPVQEPSPVQADNAGTFTFVCPSCNTMAELPNALAGKKYECKACCEESIAVPATEKKCPHCGQTIKIQAQRCKFCKKELSAGSLNDKIRQKSKDVLATSLQVSRKIKARLNLKRSIFIVSCLFFLASCIVFVFAIFSRKPIFNNRYEDDYGSESVSTSSYGSISVAESSYGTYKNARSIAANTRGLIKLSEKSQESLNEYFAADQRRKMLFNSSYSLLGIALFLLFVSFFIDQIFDKKEIITADQEQNQESDQKNEQV